MVHQTTQGAFSYVFALQFQTVATLFSAVLFQHNSFTIRVFKYICPFWQNLQMYFIVTVDAGLGVLGSLTMTSSSQLVWLLGTKPSFFLNKRPIRHLLFDRHQILSDGQFAQEWHLLLIWEQ